MGGGYSGYHETMKRRAQRTTVAMVYNCTKEWGFFDWFLFALLYRRRLIKAEKVQAVTDRLAGKKNG